jgi:hypothetical protein
MARKKCDLPKMTGALVERIETDVILDFSSEEARRRTLDEHVKKLQAAQVDKLVELGRQLGYVAPLPPDWKIATGEDAIQIFQQLAGFYARIAVELAVRMNIQGFLVPKPKRWLPEIVKIALECCDQAKSLGQAANDLEVCLQIVQAIDPEMKKRTNRPQATAEAKQLRNEVSKMRSTLQRKRDSAERARVANERPGRLH